MPDISLPEIHLPDFKLPEGLRDMNRHDIQNAIGDRMPKKIEMPDVDLSKVELPKVVEDRLNRIEKAINNVDLPKAIEARMPGRKRVTGIGSIYQKCHSKKKSIRRRPAPGRVSRRNCYICFGLSG